MTTQIGYPSNSYTAAWSNTNNAYAADGIYATATPPQNTYNWFNLWAFGLYIPADATITSVIVEAKFKVSTDASVAGFEISHYKSGVLQGTNLVDNTEPLSDKIVTLDITASNYTAAQLNSALDSDFYVCIDFFRGDTTTAFTGSLDYIKVTVTYTPAPLTITKFAQSYNAWSGAAWTNPTYVYADDGSYATSVPAKNTDSAIQLYNFNFQVPTGATTVSVKVESQFKISTTASNATFYHEVYKNGAYRNQQSDTTEPAADKTISFTDISTSWTVSEINNNTTAGLSVPVHFVRGGSNNSFTGSLDYTKVTIAYQPGSIQNTKTLAGVVSVLGGLFKQGQKRTKANTTTGSSWINQVRKTITVGATSLGINVKKITRSVTATIRGFGVLSYGKILLKALSVVVSAMGYVKKQISQFLFAISTAAGVLRRSSIRAFNGSTKPAGKISKLAAKSLNGADFIAGALRRSTIKKMTAAGSSIGDILKNTKRSLAAAGKIGASMIRGTIKEAGTSVGVRESAIRGIVRILVTAAAVTCAITRILTQIINKTLTANAAAMGKISRQTGRFILDRTNGIGSITRQTVKTLAGSAVASWSLAKQAQRKLVAVADSSGKMIRAGNKTIAGGVNATCGLMRHITRQMVAIFSALGTILTELIAAGSTQLKTISAYVPFSSSITKVVLKQLSGKIATTTLMVKSSYKFAICRMSLGTRTIKAIIKTIGFSLNVLSRSIVWKVVKILLPTKAIFTSKATQAVVDESIMVASLDRTNTYAEVENMEMASVIEKIETKAVIKE